MNMERLATSTHRISCWPFCCCSTSTRSRSAQSPFHGLEGVWTGLLMLAVLTRTSRFRRLGGFFTRWDVSWKQEVAAWREDPQHELRIWPDGWVVYLDPDAPGGGK